MINKSQEHIIDNDINNIFRETLRRQDSKAITPQ